MMIPFVTIALVEVLGLFLRFDAGNNLDWFPVLLILDSVSLEIAFQGFDALMELVFCPFFLLFLTSFFLVLLLMYKFFLELFTHVEFFHVGLPVFESFLMPVVQKRHIALEFVQVDFADIFLDAFLLELIHRVLSLNQHGLVLFEVLEAFQVFLEVHRFLRRLDLS